MIDNKLHTPEGVKDYLPYECIFKSELEKKIEYVFSVNGYKKISSPTFEYMEVFDGKGSVHSRQTYKFLDRSGDLLALRSDMTPSIARIAATAYSVEDLPLRFSYIENSFRYNEDYQGKLREFTQAGVELIGSDSIVADAEVIALAIKSLIAAKVPKFLVDIGNINFFEGVVEEAGFDNDMRKKVQHLIVAREFADVEALARENNVPANLLKLFSDLPFLTGGTEILDEAEKLVKNEKSLSALKRLHDVNEILKCHGVEEYIEFDLSVIGHLDYYTGITFRGYAFGTGFSIIDGGRYDNLVSKYGVGMPAVGFALKINRIMDVLTAADRSYNIRNAEFLCVYEKDFAKTAFEDTEKLRENGAIIENSLLGSDISKNIEYAKKNGIKTIIYYGADGVKEIDAESGSAREVK